MVVKTRHYRQSTSETVSAEFLIHALVQLRQSEVDEVFNIAGLDHAIEQLALTYYARGRLPSSFAGAEYFAEVLVALFVLSRVKRYFIAFESAIHTDAHADRALAQVYEQGNQSCGGGRFLLHACDVVDGDDSRLLRGGLC